MLAVAGSVGWLSLAEERAEPMWVIGEQLAGQHLSDPESLEELTRLFPVAESAGVQTAIAGILIRSDFKTIATPELVQTLRQHRLGPSGREDLIDVLIRRLASAVASPRL